MDSTPCISETITASSSNSTSTPPLQRMGSGTCSVITAEADSNKKLQSSKYKGVVPQPNGRWGAQIYEKHQRVWLGTFSDESEAAKAYDVAAQRFRGRDAITNLKPLVDQSDSDSLAELSFLCSHSKAEIVDMLRKHTYNDELQQSKQAQVSAGGLVLAGKKISPSYFSSGRDLLFDKVVTPSDVGKLNRLVIPKQQAEKHFPLKSSSNATACNGVLINFEDPSGKVWRFRYSYWNSSQSYVLTKGWSRFVKDKGLQAGDVVSFWRSTAPEINKFYIDAKKGASGGCTSSGAATQVVKLFGVDISENGKNGKRAREIEAFPQSMFFKKPLIVAL